MSEYGTYYNGKWTHVYELEDCIRAIQCRNADNEKRIKYLENENKKLKKENYKDEELKKMKQSLDRMQKEYIRGFPISEEEQATIEKWKIEHDENVHGYITDAMKMKAEGCCGGRYTYKFIPTTLGVIGKIYCHCGESFTFQEML